MLHSIAAQINQSISPDIMNTLSELGTRAYFPKSGILGQSADAKQCGINATIGIALEDDGNPMCLGTVSKQTTLIAGNLVPYAPSYGLPALRAEWRRRMLSVNPSLNETVVSNPVVTCALTHALSVVGQLLIKPGGILVLPDLFWGNYRLIFEQALGAKIVTFETFRNGGFNVQGCLDCLRSQAEGAVTLLLNFPNNPTGYNCTRSEAIQLRDGLTKIADERSGLGVIVDDAYFGLNYESGLLEESIFSMLADAHEALLAVKVDGATKEDYVWGFRVGFITLGYRGASSAALSALEDKCAGLVRGSISNAPRVSQAILLNAYEDPNFAREKQSKYEVMRHRYLALKTCFDETVGFSERFERLPANAGYFLCLRPKHVAADALRLHLIEHYDL
ncbi:MAG: aminotransferase class I/II-fold pyridoxal phosphate-dependent enzyme, partial [Bradymonadia bacterium]